MISAMRVEVRYYTKTGNTKRLAEALKIGIPVDSREFHCKGEFKNVHKGKPDGNDLKNIAEFAKDIISG
jgi:hypothetical protein